MSEDKNRNQEERSSSIGTISTLQGMIPPRVIHHAGVIDLRGIPAELVARLEQISSAKVVLLDENNRLALEWVTMHHIGSVVVAGPEERLIVTPQLEISRSGMESIGGAQKLLLLGDIWLKPDVPASLVAEKIESLRVVGILVACEGVHGALLGKMQLINGVTVALPDDVGPIMRDAGETRITPDYLYNLPDGTTYLSFGQTRLSDELSPDLLRQKIRVYYNMGETIGLPSLIALLQARCPVNIGHFKKS